MSISKKIDKIWQLDQRGERENTWILLNELKNEYPNNARLLFVQGALYGRDKNYNKAIESLDEAINLSPQEATYYFHRGCNYLEEKNILKALNDFSEAIDKDVYDDITFTQMLYFHRAEVFIMLGKKHEALSDLSHIPDDYQTWTFKLRCKADLIADCEKL